MVRNKAFSEQHLPNEILRTEVPLATTRNHSALKSFLPASGYDSTHLTLHVDLQRWQNVFYLHHEFLR